MSATLFTCTWIYKKKVACVALAQSGQTRCYAWYFHRPDALYFKNIIIYQGYQMIESFYLKV